MGVAGFLPPLAANDAMFVMENSRLSNVVVGVAVGSVKDEQTVAADVSRAFRLDDRSILLASICGTKGKRELGVLSAGIALRRFLRDSRTFIGANVFYDALQSSEGYSYSQIGLGAEISRDRFTLRGNYYLPVGDHSESFTERRTSHDEVSTAGRTAGGRKFSAHAHRTATDFVTRSFDALEGWDAELEIAMFEQPRFIDPSVAVGYFSFRDGDAEFSGVKVRGEVRIGSHVSLGAEWRQDGAEIDQEWRVGARFQYEFGGSRSVALPVLALPDPALPVVAMGTGKSIHEPEASDGKSMHEPEVSDGKSIRPLAGKTVRPPEPEVAPATRAPRYFLDPVARTPWPMVIGRRSVRSIDPILSKPVIFFGPAVPNHDCSCESGPVLIFP